MIICMTCGKQVKPNRGILKCCGIAENMKEALTANKRLFRSIDKALAQYHQMSLGKK